MLNPNPKTRFLIPPHTGTGDGSAVQPEPKSLAEELVEETSLVRASALKDAISYLVDEAISGTDHGIRTAINLRYNLKWVECDAIISEAQKLAGPAIEKAKAELAALEQQRLKFQRLAAMFTDPVRVQKNGDDPSKYDLLGLTDDQTRLCADALAMHEGTDE